MCYWSSDGFVRSEARYQSAIKPESEVTRHRVLLIAWPIILSNLSTPLLGLVDTAVIGNLGDPALIGAIAVGSMIFSFLYWGFGFLRMGTTGLVAQAWGASDFVEVKATLFRAACLALLIGITLTLLQVPLSLLAFRMIEGSAAVESAAATYFTFRIWAAPVSLLYLVVLGYLLGHQRSTAILWLQLVLNGTNIVLDFVFVVGLGWGVAGIAAATVIAEILALLVGLVIVQRHLNLHYPDIPISASQVMEITAVKRTMVVNRDIMIRTLCLIFGFAWFTNDGAARGDVMLAANAILMQFVSFSAFFLDGYALAAESLTGKAVGRKDRQLLNRILRYISELGLVTAIVISVGLFVCGPLVIDLLTTAESVRIAAREYLWWAIAVPVISVWCFLLDGIFIGATCTREMRNAMIVSLFIYLGSWYLLVPLLDNHGLWLALSIYYLARAGTLLFYLNRVNNLVAPAA